MAMKEILGTMLLDDLVKDGEPSMGHVLHIMDALGWCMGDDDIHPLVAPEPGSHPLIGPVHLPLGILHCLTGIYLTTLKAHNPNASIGNEAAVNILSPIRWILVERPIVVTPDIVKGSIKGRHQVRHIPLLKITTGQNQINGGKPLRPIIIIKQGIDMIGYYQQMQGKLPSLPSTLAHRATLILA